MQTIQPWNSTSKPIEEIEFDRYIDAYPFVPNNQDERIVRCLEILHIQAQAWQPAFQKFIVKML